jgi:hypothetical protein
MKNIADDPDLIDATGGYNYGCYIKSLNKDKAQIWMNAGLESDWVIQQVNGNKIQNIADLEKYFKTFQGQKVTIKGVRVYNSREFEVQIPN